MSNGLKGTVNEVSVTGAGVSAFDRFCFEIASKRDELGLKPMVRGEYERAWTMVNGGRAVPVQQGAYQ